MRSVLLFVLLVQSPLASASDPSGFLYFLFGQILLSVWPIMLPLLFLRGLKRKVRAYFILLLVTYGVLGVVGIPWNWLIQIAPWIEMDFSQWVLASVVIRHAIAFSVSLWVLAAFRRSLASPATANRGA